MITTNVRGLFYQPDGTAFIGAAVTAILSMQEIDGGIWIPHEVTETTDASGAVTLTLWPNSRGAASSQYKIYVRQGSTLVWRGTITVPEVAGIVDMHTLVQVAPYPPLDAAQLAVLQAQDYAAQGSASAAAAAGSAAEALDSQSAANGAAEAASGSANDALTNNNAAGDFASAAGQSAGSAHDSEAAADSAAAASALSAGASAESAKAALDRKIESGAFADAADLSAHTSLDAATASGDFAAAAGDSFGAAKLQSDAAATSAANAGAAAAGQILTLATSLISTQAIIAQHIAFQ